MFERYRIMGTHAILLVGVLAASVWVVPVRAQSSPAGVQSATPAGTFSNSPAAYGRSRLAKRAQMYYEAVWGVDSLSIKATESGEIIRFKYRVLDADKAKALNDKKLEPALIDPQARVKLVVPSLEKVGQLRQSSTPEVGRFYWMAFSNPRRSVKRGDRVDVMIGHFRANGLMVE